MMKAQVAVSLLLAIWLGVGSSCTKQENSSTEGAVAPQDALATFELDSAFQMELVVHEPLIASPVDMEIDEHGHMYVVEMPGYPLDDAKTGRVRKLYDTDQDGVFDKSEVFIEKLSFPNSIMRWKQGFIVADAPHILYFEDTDQDGKADKCDTLVTGFSKSNPHVNVNNPIYGLDNWIYLSHFGHIGTGKYEDLFGDKGSEIRLGNGKGPVLPVNASGKSVRFQPDNNTLEMTAVRGQFGHTFSPWGDHLLTHNQNHIYHEALAASYIARNPNLLLPNAGANVSDHGNETEVFQITTNPDRQLFTPVGVTTSSSGITYYNGGAFPKGFNENTVFVCESVANLVHMDVLEPNGATFTAKRHGEGKEFLASRDSWSRPVNMYVGPDGALYVIDYYRRIIEHPEWMSDEAVAAGGLSDGINMGRIYRITPKGTGKADWIKGLSLGKATTEELVRYLEHPNYWWRINAQRLLVDQQHNDTPVLLEQLVTQSTSPEARLHALWTLDGLGKLQPALVMRSLSDANAGIRRNAILLAEKMITAAPELLPRLVAMSNDADAKVRYQLLNTLGFVATPEAERAREAILFKDLEDEWVQYAALTANGLNAQRLLTKMMSIYQPSKTGHRNLVSALATMVITSGDEQQVAPIVTQALSNKPYSPALLTGLEAGFGKKKPEETRNKVLQDQLANTFFSTTNLDVMNGVRRVMGTLLTKEIGLSEAIQKKAYTVMMDPEKSDEIRREALQLLLLGDVSTYASTFKEWVKGGVSPTLQRAAVRALAKVPGADVGTYLISNWSTLTPELREPALEVLLGNAERVASLLNAIEQKEIAPTALGWKRTVTLMTYGDETLRTKARALLTQKPANEVLKEYQSTLSLKGDKIKGKEIYQKNCALCHQVRGGSGVSFGPDLGTVHNWESRDLLANIIDPGLSIAQGFDLWEITLKDNAVVQGMILTETSSAISIRTAPGVEQVINRQDISTIRSLPMSLMPSLNAQINPEEMADLIAYLQDSY